VLPPQRTAAHSPYLEWAKLRSQAPFNLATSGVANYPLAQLGVRTEQLEISGPGGRYGYGPLQERLAHRAGVSEQCVVAALGTSMANFLAYCGILEPGDDALIEHPAYPPMLEAAEFLGANVRRFARRFENGFALDVDEIRGRMTPRTRLVALTNLHNPSGVLAQGESLRALGEIAERAGARVLVDEVYLEMLFDPAVRSSFHLGEAFVVTSSLTKAYGLSGLRCGWILAPAELAQRLWRINDLFSNIPAHAAEQLSVMALDHLPEISARAEQLLAKNRGLLREVLAARPDLVFAAPTAGSVVFPKLLRGHTDDFVRLLREKYETSVVPGRFFEMPAHFRVGVGGESGMVREGLQRLAAALEEFSAQ
jgi:aspartate/methionine/tyrosine aminotransferase